MAALVLDLLGFDSICCAPPKAAPSRRVPNARLHAGHDRRARCATDFA
jgi:hypothetical protein